MSTARIAGVGMVKFAKPGQSEPYRVMASKAIKQAIQDAGIDYAHVQQAYASYIYGDSTCGQHALYDVGMTGIPSDQRQQQLLLRVPRRSSWPAKRSPAGP